MTELAKKLPALLAIVALAYVGVEALRVGLDKGVILAVAGGIAGLGGFYLHKLLPRGP